LFLVSDRRIPRAPPLFKSKLAHGVREIIVGTEVGILHRLHKENPGKEFYAASELAFCPHMKLTTLEKILWCLEEMSGQVVVPEKIRIKAKRAIDRMLSL